MESVPTTYIRLPGRSREEVCSEVAITGNSIRIIQLHCVSQEEWEDCWELAEVSLRGAINGRFKVAGKFDTYRDDPEEKALWLAIDPIP